VVPQRSQTDAAFRRESSQAGPGSFDRTWVFPFFVALSCLAFLPVLGNGFVNWDDPENFLRNPNFRGLKWSNFCWAWTTFHCGVYQPLAWMLFELQYQVFGMNPSRYHLVSLLLHCAVAIALYGLTYVILNIRLPEADRLSVGLVSAIAAGLFAVHPLRVEVVAWASCQGYLPCALFAILSATTYLLAYRNGEPPRRKGLTASLLLYIASLLSKPTSVGLPVALVVLDAIPLKRIRASGDLVRSGVQKWPYFLVAAVFSFIGMLSKQQSMQSVGEFSLPARLAQMGFSFCFYLLNTFFPFGLHAHHPIPPRIDLAVPAFLFPLFATLAFCVVALALRSRFPGLLAALTAHMAILLPNAGLLQFGNQLVADRYAYLSYLPWAILLGYLLLKICRRRVRTVALLALVTSLGLGIMTWHQCQVWRNSVELWTRALALEGPYDAIVLNNLGEALARQGDYLQALGPLVEAVRRDPGRAHFHLNLGTVLMELNRNEDALRAYREAVRLDPLDPEARQYFARALVKKRDLEQAVEQGWVAVRLRPHWGILRLEYARALQTIGRADEARAQFYEAVRLQPEDQEARLELEKLDRRSSKERPSN
jgi:tetratricopeptide (TPR) repeat protein